MSIAGVPRARGELLPRLATTMPTLRIPAVDQEQDRLLVTLQGLLAIQAIDIRAALNQAAQQLVAALGADKIDVFLHDPAIDSLVALGISDTPMGRRQQAIGMDRLPVANRGSCVAVFQTGAAHHTGHADQDPGELPGLTQGLGVRSSMTVPLMVAGERRGVVQATSAQPERFAERDLCFLTAVAHWVGMVVQRAELVEQTTAQAAEQGRRTAADELIAVLAHDLNNHLTPLHMHLQFIERHAERGDVPGVLRSKATATVNVERLARLIGDLLDTARLEQGLFTITPQAVDLVDLVQAVAAAFRSATTPVEVQAPADLIIAADPDRLRQALENLLANAVKHAPAGTPVRLAITTEQRGDQPWAVLTVTDEGPGIPPELLPRLFERFAAGPGSTGLGLGLYLAHGIAAAHGSTLTATSIPGAGACLTLALPSAGVSYGVPGARRR